MNATQPSEEQASTFGDSRQRILLGLVAVACFALHTDVQIAAGRPDNSMWACHMAALSVGIGLIFRIPILTAIGTLLLMVGVPSWAISLVTGAAFYPTSMLTHLGGITCGIIGLRLHRVYPRHAACWALVFLALLILASRFWTPAVFNVNLAHRPWRIVAGMLETWQSHLAFVLAMWAVLLYVSDLIVRVIVRWRLPNFSAQSLQPAASS